MPRTKQFEKKEVLEKAKTLFWKQGFHATSVQDLVDNLGINRASLYGTFGGKKQLYQAALTSYRNENMEGLKKRLAGFDSPKNGIQTIFKEAIIESLDDTDKKGCFVVNCTTEYLPRHNHILADLLDNKSTFESIISKNLERGKASGDFPKTMNVSETAKYLYTFFNGLQLISKVQDDPKEMMKIIQMGLTVLD